MQCRASAEATVCDEFSYMYACCVFLIYAKGCRTGTGAARVPARKHSDTITWSTWTYDRLPWRVGAPPRSHPGPRATRDAREAETHGSRELKPQRALSTKRPVAD